MGKYRAEAPSNNLNNRLSGFGRGGAVRHAMGRPGQIDESRLGRFKSITNRFDSRVDARIRLANQRESRLATGKFSQMIDAREVLRQQGKNSATRPYRANQNFGEHRREKSRELGSTSGNRGDRNGTTYNVPIKRSGSNHKEPLVIVTGLGNVRKEGDSLRMIKTKSRDSNEHVVISNGTNTLITLNNDNYIAANSDRSNSSSSANHAGRVNEIKNSAYEPIKIKITNNNYKPAASPPMVITKNHMDSHTVHSNEKYQSCAVNKSSSDSSFNTYNSSYKNNETIYRAEDMDYESNDFEEAKYDRPVSNCILSSSNLFNTSSSAAPASVTTLNSLNGYNSNVNTFKPSGLVVNNYTTGGLYSSAMYDNYGYGGRDSSYYEQNVSSRNGMSSAASDATSKSANSIAKDGYKLLVSNLHPRVTEDDVLELFSDIGPIKRARFVDKGLAEVVYVRIEHAKEAIQKYDLKELDGRQMVIGFAEKSHLTSETVYYSKEMPRANKSSPIMSTVSLINNSLYSGNSPALLSNPSRNHNQMNGLNSSKSINGNRNDSFYEPNNLASHASAAFNNASNTLSNRFKSKEAHIPLPESKKNEKLVVDNSIIHQVLFNKKSIANTNPVTFTVKL